MRKLNLFSFVFKFYLNAKLFFCKNFATVNLYYVLVYKGFKVIADTPIEMIYDHDLNLTGYFLLLYKSTYPFPLYVKIDKDLKAILEVYPYMVAKTKEESLALLDETKTIVYHSLDAPYYFSYNLASGDYSDDYLKIDGVLAKVRNMSIVTLYDYKKSKEEIEQIKDRKIRRFAKKMKADYACVYLPYDKKAKKAAKFFLGYSPLSEAWKSQMHLLEKDILQ